MNNYQLYRTNLLLGGQVKWDLVLKSDFNTLCVSDFHLTPISHNTPYTYKSQEYLVANKHQDNIKRYYNETKGSFYSECLDTEFTHSYPVLCDENTTIDAYSNIYDMGCKRSKRYNLYKKQFEFFCPLWIEKITGDLMFKIDVKNTYSDTILASNNLIFKTENVINTHHHKFVEYFKTYAKEAGLYEGSDDIINIIFKENFATITGIDAESGLFKTKNIDNVAGNIVLRERPLMEVDNMLMQAFKDNSMICKQLFNFNLCFNIEDIFSNKVLNMLKGETLNISVTVYMGDEQLEMKDFYTEYEYLPKFVYGSSDDYNGNVLSYLKDNEYIGFIDKNKMCQSICHWSLCENEDYIFNVYNGFSGVYVEGDKIYENLHQYANAPNIRMTKYDKAQNTAGWLKIKYAINWGDFYKYISNTAQYKTDGEHLNGKKYVCNVKYRNMPYNETNAIYVLGIVMSSKLLAAAVNKFGFRRLNKTNIYISKIKDLVIFLTSDIAELNYINFYKELVKTSFNENDSIDNELIRIREMMSNVIEPTLITFNNSLLYHIATTPILNSTEIDYVKDDNNSLEYVIRYDGKIKPSFTDKVNTLYYKDYISESKLKNSVYTKYNIMSYEPLYPSIGYCGIKNIKNWSRETVPTIKCTEFDYEVFLYADDYEYSWYNCNKVMAVIPEIVFSYKKLKNVVDNRTLDDRIYEQIASNYKTDDEGLIKYLKSLYTHEIYWDYLAPNNIEEYKYVITLKLKSK